MGRGILKQHNMGGWIKTYRQLTEWEWYGDSQMVHLLIHLILMANHIDQNWRGITIKRGQLLTSRSKLTAERLKTTTKWILIL